MKIRNIILIIILLIILACTAFFTYPKSFNKYVDCENITVSYLDLFNTGTPQTFDFSVTSQDAEFQKIIDILEKYTYRNCFDTLRNESFGRNQSVLITLTLDTNNITLSDISTIIINGTFYKIGYLGDTKSRELTDELRIALGIG